MHLILEMIEMNNVAEIRVDLGPKGSIAMT